MPKRQHKLCYDLLSDKDEGLTMYKNFFTRFIDDENRPLWSIVYEPGHQSGLGTQIPIFLGQITVQA